MLKRWIASVLLVTTTTMVLPLPVFAQQPQTDAVTSTYRVGEGDRVFLVVPERPDLNRELVVQANGAVNLPLIGDIAVEGLTIQEIQGKLLQALQDYYPSVTRIQVSLTRAVSQVVYMTGQVRSPGRIPLSGEMNLWDAIREAGGVAPGAELNNVRIIKDKSRGGTITVVDVQNALERGSVADLPTMEPGDTVLIPSQGETYTGSLGVNVFGAVVNPGVYRIQARQDLVSALLLAGGPSGSAAINRIKIIRPRDDGTIVTVAVDLNRFLNEGDPFSNPKLRPGDTIHIPQEGRITRLFKSDINVLINLVSTAVTTTALIITLRETLNNDN